MKVDELLGITAERQLVTLVPVYQISLKGIDPGKTAWIDTDKEFYDSAVAYQTYVRRMLWAEKETENERARNQI
jgi:hypothetical protein